MLLQQFQAHIKNKFPFIQPSQKFLLAVSGGIDSVVMAHLFYKSGYDFTIAHCNFQLRDAESIRDEVFVKELANSFDKELLVKRFATQEYANDKKISIQEAARVLRYEWFGEIVNGQQSIVNNTNSIHHLPFTIHFLATAHNADDNIETVLMFLFRGTGINGLTGIEPFDKKRKIIRPVLFAMRKEIEAYAATNNISWVEDSSNVTDKYTRNFFRHKIIPAIEEQFVNAKENMLGNIKRFKETEALYTQAVDLQKKKLLEYKGNEIHIPILKLQKAKPLDTIIWEIIKNYHFHAQQIDEIKKLFEADNSSYVKSATHRIIKNRNWLIIAAKESEEVSTILIEETNKAIKFVNGFLKLEMLPANGLQLTAYSNIAQLDAKQIAFPLLLRKWKQGDYFYPLGMNKKKKLSRFFIDEKLSATKKENVWVLEMDKKIIWIIGYRIDDRFKITASTKEVLKISFTAAQKH